MSKTTIEDLEKRVVKLEKQLNQEQEKPAPTNTLGSWPNYCHKCGMTFTDAYGRPLTMGFVCPKQDCPVFPKATR
jgi:hypothetical protein